MQSEQGWFQIRRGNAYFNQAATNVENWIRTHGRASLPDALLLPLLDSMERALGYQGQTVIPPNPLLFGALVRGGGDLNHDGYYGGAADLEMAYGMAGGQPLQMMQQAQMQQAQMQQAQMQQAQMQQLQMQMQQAQMQQAQAQQQQAQQQGQQGGIGQAIVM